MIYVFNYTKLDKINYEPSIIAIENHTCKYQRIQKHAQY